MPYVNNYRIFSSDDVFCIQFGESGPEELIILGTFYLTPKDTKGLMMGLKELVDKYEKEHGELETPKLKNMDEKAPKSEWSERGIS